MNTSTFSLEQLSSTPKTSAARKAAVKSRATKAPATAVKKRKPTTVEILHKMRRYTWDFEAMKRA